MNHLWYLAILIIASLLTGCSDSSPDTMAEDIVSRDVFDKSAIRQCDGDALLRALRTKTHGFAALEGRCPLALAYLLSIHKSPYASTVADFFRERPDKMAQVLADVYIAGNPGCEVHDIQHSIDYVRSYKGGYPDWKEINTFLICVEVLRQVPDESTVAALQQVLPNLRRENERSAVERALHEMTEMK